MSNWLMQKQIDALNRAVNAYSIPSIASVMRRQKIEEGDRRIVDIIDFFPPWLHNGTYGKEKVAHQYLDEDWQRDRFEKYAGVKVSDLPLYDSAVAHRRKPSAPNPKNIVVRPFKIMIVPQPAKEGEPIAGKNLIAAFLVDQDAMKEWDQETLGQPLPIYVVKSPEEQYRQTQPASAQPVPQEPPPTQTAVPQPPVSQEPPHVPQEPPTTQTAVTQPPVSQEPPHVPQEPPPTQAAVPQPPVSQEPPHVPQEPPTTQTAVTQPPAPSTRPPMPQEPLPPVDTPAAQTKAPQGENLGGGDNGDNDHWQKQALSATTTGDVYGFDYAIAKFLGSDEPIIRNMREKLFSVKYDPVLNTAYMDGLSVYLTLRRSGVAHPEAKKQATAAFEKIGLGGS